VAFVIDFLTPRLGMAPALNDFIALEWEKSTLAVQK